LFGNLGKDPELKYISGGQAVATFSLATSERFTDKSGQRQEIALCWHNIVVWGKQARTGKSVSLKGQDCLY
jgi:single-strand DNA-binding protein